MLRMRHTFESLGYQSGFYLSQLFSSTRNASSSSTAPLKQPTMPIRPPPPLFNWGPRPIQIPSASPMLASPNFPQSGRLVTPPPGTRDEAAHMFLMPHSAESRMEDMIGEHENDIKWPNGLSFFNALTGGRADEAKLLFNVEGVGGGGSKVDTTSSANPNAFLSLDNQQKIEGKFKRSFTLPARMVTSSSSTSVDHHHHQAADNPNPGEYRNEGGMYSDVMETFLE